MPNLDSSFKMVRRNTRIKRRKSISAFSKGKAAALLPDCRDDNAHASNVLKDALESWQVFKQQQRQQLGEDQFKRLFND